MEWIHLACNWVQFSALKYGSNLQSLKMAAIFLTGRVNICLQGNRKLLMILSLLSLSLSQYLCYSLAQMGRVLTLLYSSSALTDQAVCPDDIELMCSVV